MAEFKKLPLGSDGVLVKNTTPVIQSPDDLVEISFPKSGKTLTLVNQPGILILDTDPELGTRYFECSNYVKIDTISNKFKALKNGAYVPLELYDTIVELYTANKMAEYWKLRRKYEDSMTSTAEKEKLYNQLIEHINTIPFPIVAIDTVTSLQAINWAAALEDYNTRFPTRKKESIKKVDDYGGSQYIRNNFICMKDFISENAAPFKIWTGHIKEKKRILSKTQEELSVADMALEGQLGTIFTSQAHAVCTFYRNDKGCFMDFTKKEESDCGSRPLHLSNKVIKIADILEEEKGQKLPKTFWKSIYPELTKFS